MAPAVSYLMNTGREPIRSRHGLLTTVAWDLGQGLEYALEGSVFNAGSAIQWLRDGLGMISRSAECDQLAASVARHRTASILSRPSPAWARPTGICRLGACWPA